MEKNEKILVIVFTLAFTLFFINLNLNLGYSQSLYWISLLSMLGAILYHIFKVENPKVGIIIFEILILNVSLHLIYQVGFSGLYSRDSYDDMKFLEIILYNKQFDLAEVKGISNWPNLHLLTAFLVNTTGIDHFILVKYLPTIFSMITILGIYMLGKEIYNDYKIALVACLIFITIPKFISFGSIFIREIFGIFALVFCFYFIYTSKLKDKRFTLLALLFIIIIAFSHHFSSFVFLILVMTFLTLTKLIPFFGKRYSLPYKKSEINYRDLKFFNINLQTIFFILLVVLLSYWIYQAFFVWDNVGRFVSNLFTIGELPDYSASTGITSGIVTLRGHIIYYGFFLFFGLFGLILTLKLFLDKNKHKIEESTLIFFLLFCGFYGFMSIFFLESLISPDRMLTYGWLLGCIPLAAVLITLKDKKIIKKAFIVLIISFLIFNIYNIPTEYFDKDLNVLGLANDKEYAIAETIKLPISYRLTNDPKVRYGYLDVYYGYEGARNAIYDKQNTLGENLLNIPTYRNSSKLNFTNQSSIIIISEDYVFKDLNIIKTKSPQQYALLIQIKQFKNQQTNRIADLGSGIYILAP